MESPKKLLGFDFEADAFACRAPQTMKIRQSVSDIVKKIVDEFGEEIGLSDKEIYFLFIGSRPEKYDIKFNTSSQVRKLSRVLTYSDSESEPLRIVDQNQLNNVLQLIDRHFSIRAMLNVFDTLLQTWGTKNTSMLQAFIKRHLTDYEGPRKSVLKLKSDMAWYCENDGAIQLARHLLHSQIKLSDVWSYLELPDRTSSYRYFGAVSEAFVAGSKHLKHTDNVENVKNIANFLTKHNNKETSRTVLTKLIERLGRSASENLRRPIQDYVLQEWGDPRTVNAKVHWHGVTDETYQIFRQWIMKEDLRFFYNVVAKKEKRGDFWGSYFGKIFSTRIVLGKNAESLFKNDRYYQKQKGSMAKLKNGVHNQHAFVIRMGHHTFVEFSEQDVCYIYDNANFPVDLNKSEYNVQELANKSQTKDIVAHNKTSRILASLIKSEVGIDLLLSSQLGRW